MFEIAEKLPTKDEFSEQVGSVFRARSADGAEFDLALVDFEELVANEVQENFTLLFRAPGDTPQQQGLYQMHHERLGGMEIFLVPVKKDDEGLYFEAVFNNLVAAK